MYEIARAPERWAVWSSIPLLPAVQDQYIAAASNPQILAGGVNDKELLHLNQSYLITTIFEFLNT
jgi:hypothetical protein